MRSMLIRETVRSFGLAMFTCAFPFASPSKVPAVQHKSPNQADAASMPDTACPVSRYLTDLS